MSEPRATLVCDSCGSELASTMLVCPACQRLVHAAQLQTLAAAAEAAERGNRPTEAMGKWREALGLLPPGTRQFEQIRGRVDALSRGKAPPPLVVAASPGPALPATPTLPPVPAKPVESKKRTGLGAGLGVLGALVAILFKFKALAVFLLTKGKLLLLGLTKTSTLFSMFLSLGAYWALWGWKFALGLVVSIYIHEMGHVAALTRLGIKATPPMFIPGVGALIRLKQYPTSPREEARVGLAGPIWGLAAAVGAYAVAVGTGWQAWAAIAKVGAWINLFNLLPIFGLDGARGFKSLVRWQRWVVVLAFGGAWFTTHEGLLLLIMIVAIGVAVATRPADESDHTAFVTFLVLIAALSALTAIHVSVGTLA